MSQPLERDAALLAEIPWMRQLARELVSDAQGREDVVQEACWVALAQPPRAMDRTSLRAWLRKVLRSRSWLARRSSGRNEAREQLAAGARVAEPVDELVARAELQRRLLAEVLALRAPLREALLLRYYRGQDTEAIAQQLGLSTEAVRQRISRAIADLRERTREDRELRDLLWTVLPLKLEAPLAPRALRWAAALCTAVVAGVWIPLAISTAPSCALPAPAVATENATEPSVNVEGVAGAGLPHRAEIPAQAAAAAWLEVHVVDRLSGLPLSGATVSRARAKSAQELTAELGAQWAGLGIAQSAEHALSLAGQDALPPLRGTGEEVPFVPRNEAQLTTSDASGRAAIEKALPADEFLVFRAAGHAARYLPASKLPRTEAERGNALLEVELHPTAELRVVVRDVGGIAVKDAFVRLESGPYFRQDQPQTTYPLLDSMRWNGPSAEDGSLRVQAVPIGEELFATPLSRFIGRSVGVLLSPSSTAQEMSLSVVAPGSVRGRLVNQEGKPGTGVRLNCQARAPWLGRGAQTVTDDQGGFEFADLPAGPQTVSYFPAPSAGESEPRWTGAEFGLTVQPFSKVDLGEVRAVASALLSGRVQGLSAGAQSLSSARLHQAGRSSTCLLDDAGRFNFYGVPGKAFLEVLQSDSPLQSRIIAAQQLELPSAGVEINARPTLASIAFEIAGFGGPDSKFCLRLHERAPDARPGTPQWRAHTSRYDIAADSDTLIVDALPSGEFAFDFQASDGRAIWIDRLKLEAGKRLQLGRLAFASARVRGSFAGAVGGAEAVARRDRFMSPSSHPIADPCDEVRAPIGERGDFEFGALAAGFWYVRAVQGNSLISGPAYLEAKAGSAFSIALPALAKSEIRCRVQRAGNPVVGATLNLTFDADWETWMSFELSRGESGWQRMRTDSAGVALFQPKQIGGCEVSVAIGNQHCSRRIDLAAGQVCSLDFDLALPATELELNLPPEWIERITAVEFASLDGSSPTQGLKISAERSGARLWNLRVPAGRGVLQIDMDASTCQASRLSLPIVVAADHKRQIVELPQTSVALAVAGSEWGCSPPKMCVIEHSALKPAFKERERIPSWPLERQADGTWIARGIAPDSTLLVADRARQPDGQLRERRVHFDGGRLELNWP